MPRGLGKSYESLTQEDKDLIVKLFQEDRIKTRAIAKMIPTTIRAIPKVLKEAGICTKRKNRYTLNEYYFDNIDTERKAYWLGVISADGCITTTNYFALAMTDKDVVEQLKKDLNYTGDVYAIKRDETRSIIYRINFSSKILCDSLRNLGIKENKSLRLDEFPPIDDSMIKHYIRGYFDGDGSINSCYGNVRAANGKAYMNKRWSFSIIATYKWCQSLHDYIYNLSSYDGSIRRSYKCDQMFYYTISAKDVLYWIYHLLYDKATFSMKRKYDKWQNFLSAYKPSVRKAYRKLSKLLETPEGQSAANLS